MVYTPTAWVNGVTPINATNLLKIENGIDAVDARVATLVEMVTDHGADPTGVANSTAAFIAARDVGNGAIVYVPKGTYLCAGIDLDVPGQVWELAEGATIKAIPSITTSVITILGDGVRFTGGAIDGNKTNQTVDRVGLMVSAENVTVQSVEAHNCRADGIALSVECIGSHIIGNHCHDNGITTNAAAGIQVVNASGNRIIGNLCENNGTFAYGGANDGDGIRLQGSGGAGTGQNVVANNVCRSNARRGVKVQNSFASVTGNVFSGNGVAGVGVTNATTPADTPTVVSGNVSVEDYRGLHIDNCRNLIISNNVILGAVDYGVLANTAPFGVVMSGNLIQGGDRHGALIQGAEDWTITGNLFLDNGQAAVNRYGLVLELDTGAARDCSRINVTGNTSHNTGSGTTQTHGFVLTGTAPDRIIFIGNNSSNGVATPFSLVSSRTNSYEQSNPGLADSRVTLSASVTAAAPLNIPHGTAPSSPVNGDIWTTTSGLFVRINGATVGPLT